MFGSALIVAKKRLGGMVRKLGLVWAFTGNVLRRLIVVKPNKHSVILTTLALLAVVGTTAALALAFDNWEWLRGYKNGQPPIDLEPPNTTIRNIALGWAAFIALVIAIWRGYVANRQAAVGEQQLLNERLQRSTEMLGSPVMAVRLGGIYQLQQLAREKPRQYHIPVMQTLCGFVREPPDQLMPPQETDRDAPRLRLDVQAAVDAIQDRVTQNRLGIEESAQYRPDLSNASLRGASLHSAQLQGIFLNYSDLSFSMLISASFSGCSMVGVKLCGANLTGADLRHSWLNEADFSGADLLGTRLYRAFVMMTRFSTDDGDQPAIGLTQRQLDSAVGHTGAAAPRLAGVVDALTREPLRYRYTKDTGDPTPKP